MRPMKYVGYFLFIITTLLLGITVTYAAEAVDGKARAQAMSASSGVKDFAFADWIVQKVRDNRKLTFRLVVPATELEFFKVLEYGHKKAGEELKINYATTGATAYDFQRQKEVIENLITTKVDGLIIVNSGAEALNPIIIEALKAGIPTVTANGDIKQSVSLAFYGQDLYQSGVELGKALIEYMGTSGKIINVTSNAGASWSVLREKGLKDTIANTNIKILNIFSTGTEDQAVYATIENAILANRDLTGIVCFSSSTTPAAGRAIKREGLSNKITHIGSDLLPETLDNIKTGSTKASIGQNPVLQGYLPTLALYDFIVKGKVPKTTDTGIEKVDKSNVQKYLDKRAAGEPVM